MKVFSWIMAATLLSSTTAAARGITYDCDTAAGHFSELRLPVGDTFSARGVARLMVMAEDDQWAPNLKIVLSNDTSMPGPSDEAWAGFTMGNLPRFAERVPAVIMSTVRDKGESATEVTLGAATAREINFDFAFDGETLTMNVDGQRRSFPFRADQPVLQISCSTGEFLISDLEISSGG